jgi:O-antigen/teichoic acid export membrane protein
MATGVELWSSLGRNISEIRTSPSARLSVGNAFFSVADYIAQPIAMIIAAPFLVRRLGLPQYGVWMLVSAVLGSMALLSAGFGDATVKYVSKYRGLGDILGVRRVVRATLGLNACLAALLGGAIWASSRCLAFHVFKIEPVFQSSATWALRVSAVIILVRSLETVFISCSRAYEQYGSTMKVSILCRALSVVAAIVTAGLGHGVASIMLATLAVGTVGLIAQAIVARQVLESLVILPSFERGAFIEIFSFGCFSWLQSLSGLLFVHGDRLVIGALLGTSAVAYYTICVQASQPIHGLISAAFNFLFPRISVMREAGRAAGLKRAFWMSMKINLWLALIVCLPIAAFSKAILQVWMGREFAVHTYLVLSILCIGYTILAANVVPHYVLLGFGKVRYVTVTNALGGVLSLVAALCLVPWLGLVGASLSRLLYGPAVSLNFAKVFKTLSEDGVQNKKASPAV